MGNFHCIPSGCATVVYREYLPPVTRYRYSASSEWIYLSADSYTTETIQAELDPTKVYYWEMTVIWDYAFDDLDYPRYYSVLDLRFGSYNVRGIPSGRPLFAEVVANRFELLIPYEYENPNGDITRTTYNFKLGSFFYAKSWEVTLICEVPNGAAINCDQGSPPPTTCKTTFYLNDAIVETLESADCPEVEILPCRLSEERKNININKLPWREKIQVVGEDNRDALFGDFSEAAEELINGNISNNCREIWRTPVLDLPDLNFVDNDLTLFANYYELISTICSADDCPPPEYEVICDCKDDCESCPENTCVIECDGVICCYDRTTGKSIKSIPIADYCGV